MLSTRESPRASRVGQSDDGSEQSAETRLVTQTVSWDVRWILTSLPSRDMSAVRTMAVTDGVLAAARSSARVRTKAADPTEPQMDGRGAAGGGGLLGGSGGAGSGGGRSGGSEGGGEGRRAPGEAGGDDSEAGGGEATELDDGATGHEDIANNTSRRTPAAKTLDAYCVMHAVSVSVSAAVTSPAGGAIAPFSLRCVFRLRLVPRSLQLQRRSHLQFEAITAHTNDHY